MNWKDFLKPTAVKIALFAILFLILPWVTPEGVLPPLIGTLVVIYGLLFYFKEAFLLLIGLHIIYSFLSACLVWAIYNKFGNPTLSASLKKSSVYIAFIIILLSGVAVLDFYNKTFVCHTLNESQCRGNMSCVPLGSAQKAYFVDENTGIFWEEEKFIFTECVVRVADFYVCPEVVKMTQMDGGSKFPKECRCCCGEGPFCEEKPYPKR